MARATNHKAVISMTNSIRICIVYYLCEGGHDCMWITEVENRNAHEVLKEIIAVA